jgi:hypothetical protein
MIYALVNAAGEIVRREDFDSAPQLSPLKGLRWLPDAPPNLMPWQVRTQVDPIPAAALEVPYVVADKPLEQIKNEKRDAIDTLRAAKERAGYSFTLNNQTHVLQTRNERDLLNWTAVYTSSLAAMIGGQGGASVTIRTEADDNLTVTATQAVGIINGLRSYGGALYAASWAHKDAVDALTTAQAVFGYDISAGW